MFERQGKIGFQFIVGTRPEAIKTSPLVLQLRSQGFSCQILNTGQHPEMTKVALSSFGLIADEEFESLRNGQTLVELSERILGGIRGKSIDWSNLLTVVQGDTTSALMGALAGFLNTSTVIHIEGGLRSGDALSPFPEEMNRKLISHLARLHFVPTIQDARNLIQEGVEENAIFVVGNTVTDALRLMGVTRGRKFAKSKKRVLITLHRRENQMNGMIKSYTAQIAEVASVFQELVDWIFILHPNPNARGQIDEKLKMMKSVTFIEPLDYVAMAKLWNSIDIVLTDSGGLQEEATYLGIPTLILRSETERIDSVNSGVCELIGKDMDLMRYSLQKLISDKEFFEHRAKPSDAFGDGWVSKKISDVLLNLYS